jgi:hypothetical protein
MRALFVEINPRATQTSYLVAIDGKDPLAELYGGAAGFAGCVAGSSLPRAACPVSTQDQRPSRRPYGTAAHPRHSFSPHSWSSWGRRLALVATLSHLSEAQYVPIPEEAPPTLEGKRHRHWIRSINLWPRQHRKLCAAPIVSSWQRSGARLRMAIRSNHHEICIG